MSSLTDQPICSGCSAPCSVDTTPLNCSECGKSCCAKCSREPNEAVSLFSAPYFLCTGCFKKRREIEGISACELHPERCLDLYCLTCGVQICCDCFFLLAEHKRHMIDSVEAIYRQKLLETVEKFREIPKRLKQVDWDAVRQVDDNLKIVQEIEQQIINDVTQLVQQRTSVMLEKTTEKKRILMRTKAFISKTELQHRLTLEQIKSLKTDDFLRHQETLNQRCDRILKDVEQLQVEPVRWDDIECDLLPVCKLQSIVLNIPCDASHEGKRIPIQLVDSCGIQWTTIFYVGPVSFSLEMLPNEMKLDEFHFKVVVEISHPSRMKIAGKSFTFREKLLQNELISIEKLYSSGFLSTSGDLKLRIGVRPENIIEENDLLKVLLLEQRKTNCNAQVELAALRDQNFIMRGEAMRLSCELKQTTETHETQLANMRMVLKQAADERPSTPASPTVSTALTPTEADKKKLSCDMKRLQAKLETMRITMKSMNPYAIGSFEIYRWSKECKFYSPQLTSYNGITIYVIVQPNFGSDNNSAVNAYVCWAKGPKKMCEIFMEVVNEFEEECVRQDRVFDFSKGTSFTWKSVITHYALFRDGGFLGDDNLKIKFGLRPRLE